MRIKKSNRGLTFSFAANDTFRPGTHYRYIVDTAASEIILVADEAGKYKLSKKGANAKPLVDLRNEEIKQAMSKASYMEVEIMGDRIIVHIIKLDANVEGLSDRQLVDMLDKTEDITFEIDKKALIEHDSALIEMLTAAGIFSEKNRNDLSYVFDVVSLFSGAGLLDYPFATDDDFDIKFAVDFDEGAVQTYKKNVGDHILCMDIRDLDERNVPSADLLIGGVPCVGYSNSNRAGNEALDIEHRLLVDDFIRICRGNDNGQPKYSMFVIENVRQFLTKENGRYLEKVLTSLSDDYNITYSVVNDSSVGGYSNRERMVLIGSLKEMGKVVIPDVELSSHKTAGDALRKVDSSWFNYNDITKASQKTVEKMAYVKPGHNYKDIPEMAHLDRHSNVYRRLSENEPAPTITNWRKVNLMPPVGNRILSVSEAAAIMGLNKDFKFYGKLPQMQQACGNGVTQHIARFIKAICKTYLYKYANESLGLSLMAA